MLEQHGSDHVDLVFANAGIGGGACGHLVACHGGTSWLLYSEAFAFLVFGVAWLVKGREGFGRRLRAVRE
jgi:hypothetical protein